MNEKRKNFNKIKTKHLYKTAEIKLKNVIKGTRHKWNTHLKTDEYIGCISDFLVYSASLLKFIYLT